MHHGKQYFIIFAVFLTIMVLLMAGCTGTAPAASPASSQVTPAGGTVAAPQGPSAAAFPDLIGVWTTTGTAVGHKKDTGFYIANTTRFTITEQQGQAFSGTKDYKKDGIAYYENLSGAMSDDGKKVYIAEHEQGYYFGDIIGPDEIMLVYLQDGDDAAARVFHIIRQRT